MPEEFLKRMSRQLSKESFDGFLKSYDRPPERAIRVNTLKISVEDFKKLAPFSLEPVPWEKNSFYVESEGLGKTIYHAAGAYYVQEPSAASVAPQLEVKSGERVLDLCSAPGGKGTQLAQYLGGNGVIILNEINFKRAQILLSNVERLGIKNAVVTCAPPEELATAFGEYFDKILVDAPCSGEGMFKKEPNAIPEWSVENVKKCSARQRDILDNAYLMLANGGRLVYSTCTFAPEEDEEQTDWFLKTHGCLPVKSKKLYPHEVRGEGHFYQVYDKRAGGKNDIQNLIPSADKKLLSIYKEWEKENLKITFSNILSVGQKLYSLPENMPQMNKNIQILCAGVFLGEVDGGRFQPAHALAMCLKSGEVNCVEVDESTALNYLRGLTFDCESGKGWRLVAYNNLPLGWCKVSDGVAKNHLPKGLRINK
ncbi:MAG: RsmB/NOP family class I SAM-dependent RNA methyltransferase [Clostridia bacterium]|nr:RsmB/NOP family class I SAM-dependent RNA methyltransferase [Clostridia bacterium]